jgi:rhodanese-related sulfurtransferase
MEWYHYVLIALAAFIITMFILSYRQTKKSSVKINIEEFKANMRKGQLIDCRSKQEFETGHINGARNISVAQITREYQKLRKDQPIYLYCESGKRSGRAAVYLRSRGFNDVYELQGGLKSWDGPLRQK